MVAIKRNKRPFRVHSYEYRSQTKLPNKDNRTIYNEEPIKGDTYYDKPIGSINGYYMVDIGRDVRVPSLKRKSAWKRFYRLFPQFKGRNTITGYSTSCYIKGGLNPSTIKLKNI